MIQKKQQINNIYQTGIFISRIAGVFVVAGLGSPLLGLYMAIAFERSAIAFFAFIDMNIGYEEAIMFVAFVMTSVIVLICILIIVGLMGLGQLLIGLSMLLDKPQPTKRTDTKPQKPVSSYAPPYIPPAEDMPTTRTPGGWYY